MLVHPNVTSVLIIFQAVYTVSVTINVLNVKVAIIFMLTILVNFVNLLLKVVFIVTLPISAFNVELDFISIPQTINVINVRSQDVMFAHKLILTVVYHAATNFS